MLGEGEHGGNAPESVSIVDDESGKISVLPVHVALREQPSNVVPARVTALLELLVIAGNISGSIVRKRSGLERLAESYMLIHHAGYSRHDSVVLNLVLQSSQALDYRLALLGLLSILLSRDSLVDIVNGTSLL